MMGIIFLVFQIVFDILAFIGYMRLAAKIDDTYEYVEIESVKTRYLEKQSAIFKDSIKLQNESLRDVFDLTKKVIEYNEPKELDTEKHDTKALVSGWDTDEIDEPELVSVEEFRKNIDSMACQRINPYAQQAINECIRKAVANRELAKYNKSHVDRANDLKNAEECEQFAEWLKKLQERRKAPEIITCGECIHKRDFHYEEPGEEPYIKSICENKYGLTKGYQVHDLDFCSRAERRTDG